MSDRPVSPSEAEQESQASLFGIAARDLMRLRAVIGVITRHGFGELFQRSPLSKFVVGKSNLSDSEVPPSTVPAAVRFRRLLENLGPTYIKFGQIMSMRPDLLPQEYIAALENLQDQAPVVPVGDIKDIIRRGLGRPVEEIFASFDDLPLATASIGQTHRAVTLSGDHVVVKVQRPGIEQIMRSDLDLVFMLAKLLEVGIEELQLIRPSEVVSEFEKALVRELDFSLELANLMTARSFIQHGRAITVPKPYPEYSSRTVLTMEYFAGKSLRKVEPKSEQAKHAVTEIVHAALKQVLVDGFFHGDPHMGNILINDENQVCLIDYGLVGRLTKEQQSDIIGLLVAVIGRDATMIAHTLLRMGTPMERVNIAALKAEITRIMDTYLVVGELENLNSQELANAILAAAQRFKIKMAPEYTILVKALTTIEGVIRTLYPDIDLVGIATPYIQTFMAKRFSPKNLMADSISGFAGLSAMMRQLPGQFEQIMHDAETGNIQVRAITPDLDMIAPMLHQLAGRLALTGFASTMTLAAVMLLTLGTPGRVSWMLEVAVDSAAAFSWVFLWLWYLVGRGKPIRLRALLQFFRR